MLKKYSDQYGFTIVELLIVIVVIAILAALTIVAYNGISTRASEATLQSDLRNASNKLAIANITDNTFPLTSLPSDVNASSGNTFSYVSNGTDFCLSASSSNSGAATYHITKLGVLNTGDCPAAADGDAMQTITKLTCPTSRIRAHDARDNHTYWVQRLSDGQCWMLTNLAYAGNGTNTYGDTMSLTLNSLTVTEAAYFVVPSTTNFTTEPTAPSTSTDGTGQYGYLYNWCGAMGEQATAACNTTTTPAINPAVSVCPSGWRLPTGGAGGEIQALNNAVNGGLVNTDAGLRTQWLAQRGGRWASSFSEQGSGGYYWTSSPYQSSGTAANRLFFTSGGVGPGTFGQTTYEGLAVRCVAI